MESTLKPNHLTSFLMVYFYSIEKLLNEDNNGLENIGFQSEEANTDEFQKRFFQEYLLQHNNIKETNIEKLSIKVDIMEYQIDISELKSFSIVDVLMPKQLTQDQKKKITETKRSVYTNPDLYLEISDGTNIYYESLELKSTKDNNIPGSSVQQVSPYEWVIFVKREDAKVTVTTGYYINSITEKLPFPDRSPRPQVGFKTLLEWNKKFRIETGNILLVESNIESTQDKIRLLEDWQDFLASEWMEIILAEKIKPNEKWFNSALRKFAIKFLDYTQTLDKDERQGLIDKLNDLVK